MSITGSERSWLIAYCTKHTVAHCGHCDVGFRYLELVSDLIVDWRFQFCPGCRGDLTSSLRDHLRNCAPVQSTAALLCDLCREVILASKATTLVDGGRARRHHSCHVTTSAPLRTGSSSASVASTFECWEWVAGAADLV